MCSALDLSTQARVLDCSRTSRRPPASHTCSSPTTPPSSATLSHRVAVMYQGEIVEYGDGGKVTSDPDHPYIQRLLLAAPVPDPIRQEQRRAGRRRLLDQ